MSSEIDLKIVFSDVLRGFTVIKSEQLANGIAYIKHLNIFDNIQTDKNYSSCLKEATKKGLPTDDDQKEYLDKEKLWTKEDELELEKTNKYIDGLQATKSKLYLKSQIEPIKEEIKESEDKLRNLIRERENLIGFTAERYAAKRSNELYIQNAVYKDKELTKLAIDSETFNHMTDQSLALLTKDYSEATREVTLTNLKKVSLMPFFCNYYYLCDDNPQIFYGKPVVDLTFFQAELFAFGRYFKSIAQEAKASPPDDIKHDPDKLIEFYEMRKNADEAMDKLEEKSGGKSGASSLVGATKDDLDAIGVKTGGPQTVNLSKLAKDKGGQLSMDDFVDLHG